MMLEYYIINPTGNITALVIDKDYSGEEYKKINDYIIRKHNNVEQVGFVSFENNKPYLRMAGGEFCGNATISAAALYCDIGGIDNACIDVTVFGVKKPLKVDVEFDGLKYDCCVDLKKPDRIINYDFSVDGRFVNMPVVCLEGIFHIIADKSFKTDNVPAFLSKYCDELSVPAIGLMIFDAFDNSLKPIVYVKKCNTLFYENSCASGSCAVCAYLVQNKPELTKIDLTEPGGTLSVESSMYCEAVRLFGSAEIIGKYGDLYDGKKD